jgi:DNA mismatch endonuclease Vsr
VLDLIRLPLNQHKKLKFCYGTGPAQKYFQRYTIFRLFPRKSIFFMVDKVDTETRSRMMANVKSKNTKPELKVRSLLHRRGLRFRLHGKDLPGKPDIILPKFKAVIFVNGCFWHGHKNCKLSKLPTTRIEFWKFI